ncbi:MAG: response regulator transcription factor [Bifidobacteriaceae bacterium]|jgi:two-component system response regulator MtrA|nr:response regulator transcription factor [Bifidobacteriaceae bacterium]
MARILVIDDDTVLAEMIGIVLAAEHHDVGYCASGDRALMAFRDFRPELVLLDLMLPGVDGIEVCRRLRAESDVPVVMLTAKGETADIVAGLEAGADDYIPKPFKPAELAARVKTRLRGRDSAVAERLHVDDIDIDVAGHEVRRGTRRIALTPLEFELLVALAAKPWQVFSRDMLLQQVWGYQSAADTRLVNVHVQRLRSKVEADPDHPRVVLTVRGVGYRAGPPS